MNKQRRSQIKEAVIEVLQNCKKQLTLPIPIKAITKSFPNVRLIPFSVQMQRRNLSYDEMVVFAGTEDACTDYDAKTDIFVVYYNDLGPNQISSNRYRWNIAHELGHIALNHHQKYTGSRIFRNSISKVLYRELEDEADQFAAYILVPHIVVNFVGADLDGPTLKNACKISGAAAGYRLSGIRNWRRHSGAEKYDFALLEIFCNFVEDNCRAESVRIWLNSHRSCSNCHSLIPHRDTQFCSSCGTKYIPHYEMEKKIMEYSGVNTHANGNAMECPQCHNTELTDNGSYCMICGSMLPNHCTGNDFQREEECDYPLPGNARYCPHCGSPSSFFKYGFLEAWDGKRYVDGELMELPF